MTETSDARSARLRAEKAAFVDRENQAREALLLRHKQEALERDEQERRIAIEHKHDPTRKCRYCDTYTLTYCPEGTTAAIVEDEPVYECSKCSCRFPAKYIDDEVWWDGYLYGASDHKHDDY